mmetsp:Transcript_28203/g.52934  ORF Transcript_28203/g.52934 Transcript_28203/m.52934 type:complete len:265 (-) Transcript_28203:31-825(-)
MSEQMPEDACTESEEASSDATQQKSLEAELDARWRSIANLVLAQNQASKQRRFSPEEPEAADRFRSCPRYSLEEEPDMSMWTPLPDERYGKDPGASSSAVPGTSQASNAYRAYHEESYRYHQGSHRLDYNSYDYGNYQERTPQGVYGDSGYYGGWEDGWQSGYNRGYGEEDDDSGYGSSGYNYLGRTRGYNAGHGNWQRDWPRHSGLRGGYRRPWPATSSLQESSHGSSLSDNDSIDDQGDASEMSWNNGRPNFRGPSGDAEDF